MRQKVLLLSFDHPMRAVVSVGLSMAQGLVGLGIQPTVISVPSEINRLSALNLHDIDGVLVLGTPPLDLRIDHDFFFKKLHCPIWVYFLDAPIYDLWRVPAAREFFNVAGNRSHLIPVFPENGYLKLLGRSPEGGFFPPQSRHIPFGCFPQVRFGPGRSEKSAEATRICIIGTIGTELGVVKREDTLRNLIENFSPASANKHAMRSLEELLLSPEAPDLPAAAMRATLGISALDLVSPNYLRMACAIDSWAKRDRRLRAVQSLQGVDVDFFGTGWSEYFPNEKRFRFFQPIVHDDIAETVRRYKALINFDPCWDEGLHDRVYTASAIGAKVLTNSNAALQKTDLPRDLVLTYDHHDPRLGEIAGEIKSSDEGEKAARLEVIVNHGWTQRMGQLVLGSS